MSRKDFEFIAATIRGMADSAAAECAAHEFAARLGQTNPRFDKVRFLKACGADTDNPGYGVRR